MMIVLKDCPNCGSFDVEKIMENTEGGTWMQCHACGCDWDEGQPPNHASVIDFAGRDDGSYGEYE